MQGLIQDFSQRGEILACGRVPKLGGLGVCSPRKLTASGGF